MCKRGRYQHLFLTAQRYRSLLQLIKYKGRSRTLEMTDMEHRPSALHTKHLVVTNHELQPRHVSSGYYSFLFSTV